MNITGYVFPSQQGQPVLVLMMGSLDPFLPLFATTERLRVMMRHADITYDSIKHVDDQVEFIDSLPHYIAGGRLRIMVDPYTTAEGRIRFKELFRETVVRHPRH
jgi:hypothetical protein